MLIGPVVAAVNQFASVDAFNFENVLICHSCLSTDDIPKWVD